jgi:class 3 adenylate cyclase/tetratricopeptide (TPR) repeat protein
MALCPSCGEDNPEKAKFCLECGAVLTRASGSTREERKIVSILFVDLVGFTARSHEADPEDVRAALVPYHRLLKREIERFGGTVEKFIGDAVMAVFGAPIAHEDDAERAVRAALRITEELARLNEESPFDLAMRAAVNTGEGLVVLEARPGAGEGMVTGDVVNTASRLQNVAPIDGVVVGEMTYLSTKAAIDYEELEPVSVKGKPEPLPLWRALASKSHFGVDTEMRSATTFVGRDYELNTLKGTFKRSLNQSSVELVTIVGEPGVGKTRLLAEFASFLDDQEEFVIWRQGRSLPYGEGITFWALGEVIKAHAGVLESDQLDVASAKLRDSVAGVIEDEDERQWFHARLSALIGVEAGSGSVQREESFTAWRRFLEGIAAQTPLVLVLEDLHWADEAMLDFVEHLVDWSTGVPMLVVCTARPELHERRRDWAGGKRNSHTISLPPLNEGETARLISSLLDQAVLPREIQGALLERAGGNPLYAEEFIRMLGDKGMLLEKNGEVTIPTDADISLPSTVQAVIAARLDTLPPDRKALLHDASIVGKVFWSGAVEAIGGAETVTVRQGLHELLRKEIVRPARSSSIQGEDEYSFWHGLIRDVSYSQIPRAARSRKHEAMAQWLERFVGDRAADHADILAYHYGQALELARASGFVEELERLKGATRHFLVLAGDRAMALDVRRAKTFYQEALGLSEGADRARVLLKLAEVQRLTGDSSEGEATCREAIEAFLKAGLEIAAAEAMLELAMSVGNRGDNDQCFELESRAIALLEGHPASPELASAYAVRSQSLAIMGDPRHGLEWANKSIVAVEPFGVCRSRVAAYRARGMALYFLGDPAASESFEEALEMASGLGLIEAVSLLYSDLGGVAECHEGPSKALEIYTTNVEYARGRGVLSQVIVAKVQMGPALFMSGRWDESLDLADEIIASGRKDGDVFILGMGLHQRMQVLTYRGESSAFTELIDEMIAIARDVGEVQLAARVVATAALAHHVAKADAAAIGLVAEFTELTKDGPFFRSTYLLEPFRVLVASGEAERGQDLLLGLDPRFEGPRNNVLTAQALLAEAKGESEEALHLFKVAVQRWRGFGVPLEEGQAKFGVGRCLTALGHRDGATSAFEEARGIFSDLGATMLIKEIDASLGRAAKFGY